MITAWHDPGFEVSLGEGHIMPIRKFGLVADGARSLAGVSVRSPAPAKETDLARVHSGDYIRAVRTGEPRELAESQKFPWSPRLFHSVSLTSGACVAAGRSALVDGVSAAIASGFHHAHADHGEGFCTFNGVVVAAEALSAEGKANSFAVADFDLHYGNGTASLATSRPWLRALSVYGNDYSDNKPYRDVSERWHEDGPNHFSLAVANRSGRDAYLRAAAEGLEWLGQVRPDLVFYQAGADPYREDPYSPLDLGVEDLMERDRVVFDYFKRRGIPVAWVLAGGYTEDVSKVVEIHVNTFRAAIEIYG